MEILAAKHGGLAQEPGFGSVFFFKRSLDNPQEMGKMGNLLTSLSKKNGAFQHINQDVLSGCGQHQPGG